MNAREVLYHWIARYRLEPRRSRQLFALAGLDTEPAAVAHWCWRVVAVAAAALGGLGLILWLAANWGELGRASRFALLQGAVLVLAAGAAWQPRARPALGLLALLCIGGLFAYFGQTYQTGADAWQLFALWALLALPLALGTRSDVVWAPWALVAATGISLWIHAQTGHRWRAEARDLPVFLAGWGACGLLVLALGPAARRWTGAGTWSLRTAGTLAVAMVTLAGVAGLFGSRVAPYPALALLLLAAAAALLARGRGFDVFLLSAVVLALDTLIVGGLARLLLPGARGEAIGALLLLGLLAAGLLAASVSVVTRLARRHG